MAGLVLRKTLLALFILPILNLLGYFYAQTYPGLNPFFGSRGQNSTNQDQPYPVYLQELLQGNLGRVDLVPISELLVEPLRNSLILLSLALFIVVLLGPLLGVLSVSSRTRRITPLALLITMGGASMPGFFLGAAIISTMLYLVLYTSATVSFLPISGFGLDKHLILPILVLASRPTLQVAKVTATLFENELQRDYVQVARSKGLTSRRVSWRHVWPNIVSPVLVTIGASIRLLISGLLIVEALFQWPGVGNLLMLAIGIRTDGRAPVSYFANPELLAALAVIFGFLLLCSDLIITILATGLDPRVRESVSESRL